MRNAADQTGRLIAAMIRPHLDRFRTESPSELRTALAGASIDDTNVKVLVRLKGSSPDDFLYIAAAPPLPADYLKRERDDLMRSGVFQRLAPTCDRKTDFEVRFVNPAGKQEVLTSMTPVHVGGDCWIIITSQNAAALAPAPLNLSFWTIPANAAAAVIYGLGALLVVWLLAHMWRNVARFRGAARRIRLRGAGAVSFRELNSIPELNRVAEDFDALVMALTDSQAFIKETAEENSHALKAPLAVIAQSIEPIRRAIPQSDPSAQRSLQLIERSVAKLDSLVSSSRDLEQAAAEVVYPVRRPMDLSAFLTQMLSDYDITLVAQEKRLAASIAHGVTAYANEDLLEPVIENILENAASFTPRTGTVEVILERKGDFARIHVADRGPGVPPDKLPHIFDRYMTYRLNLSDSSGDSTAASAGEFHQGLGLWIVKRNVEGLGGTVTARNRIGGGFEIIVDLKAKA
ncbi:MAG: HAMP domain-containing histidine kinase [Alphaproteobacteria bacterium]|nr:HAMP domain-containing histidine kinase [Alphaproteobacteria bacterium]